MGIAICPGCRRLVDGRTHRCEVLENEALKARMRALHPEPEPVVVIVPEPPPLRTWRQVHWTEKQKLRRRREKRVALLRRNRERRLAAAE